MSCASFVSVFNWNEGFSFAVPTNEELAQDSAWTDVQDKNLLPGGSITVRVTISDKLYPKKRREGDQQIHLHFPFLPFSYAGFVLTIFEHLTFLALKLTLSRDPSSKKLVLDIENQIGNSYDETFTSPIPGNSSLD